MSVDETQAAPTLVSGPAELDYCGVESLPEIMPVMNSSFLRDYGEAWNEQQCRSMLILNGTRLLVARIDGKVCGFAFSRMVLDEEELLMIAVDPNHQKIGVGRQLVDQVIANSRQCAVNSIFLEVRSNNNARHLYHEMGFKEIGIRKAYYTGPNNLKYDAITYKKILFDRS